MSNRHEDRHIFLTRAFIFRTAQIILGLIVIAKLVYLQIYNATHFVLLSDRNRIVTQRILATRGTITDTTGQELATNRYTYSAYLDLNGLTKADRDKLLRNLPKVHDLNENVEEKIANPPKIITPENRYITLKEDLDQENLQRLCIVAAITMGITLEKNRTREYKHAEALSHVIGYIGAPTKEDIENSENSVLSHPMAKIGKTCIERQYDAELFGKAGIQHVEVDARRQFIRNIDNIEETPGHDIQLTINLDLQLEVYKILSQHESGSCVVMDAHTGAILAFVSYPGYDTNIFTKKIDGKILKELYENPYKPMINKVISGLYSPGSVFKMITALTALKKGIINKHTRFNCDGCYELGNHKFHCWKWKYGGHGYMDLEDAIAESCDVFFYNLARMLSPDEIAKTARDFGLGELTGIDLPNEKSGLIPTKAWKKDKKKQSWTTGDTLNMSIGQGFVLVTPLQLAKMTAMLVNGMKPITPHLNKSFEVIDKPALDYDPEHIKIILDGMNAVVNSNYGTARASAIDDECFQFGGKTGSSQVFRITEQLRREGKTVSSDYWKKEHAVFVGYAPVDDPQFVVSILIEHGGGGSHTAAPIARDVLLAVKKYCNPRK